MLYCLYAVRYNLVSSYYGYPMLSGYMSLYQREREREMCTVYLKSQLNLDKTPNVVKVVLFPFSYFIDETITVFDV